MIYYFKRTETCIYLFYEEIFSCMYWTTASPIINVKFMHGFILMNILQTFLTSDIFIEQSKNHSDFPKEWIVLHSYFHRQNMKCILFYVY